MAFGGRALPFLRIAGLTLAASIAASAGVGYWFFVSQQRDYIIGRDFRILTNLTRQIDSTARAETRVIRNLPKEPGGPDIKTLPDAWSKLRGKPYKAADIAFKMDKRPAGPIPGPTLHPNSLMLDVPLENDGRQLIASLNLQPAIETLFSSTVGPDAFDAILLGTRDGRVLVSAGSGAEQLRFSGLDMLESKERKDGAALKFKELSEAITMADVTVAGVDYTLFVAPCCLFAKTPAERLVLAGLVSSEKVRASSWAIPTTLVKVSVLALLIALVGWPFLKLVLLGDRQQVGVTDFFQLGASSVAGLAILTVVMLDVSAYWRLNRDLDAQLSDLAHALDNNATAEIKDANAQLTCIEETLGARKTIEFDGNRLGSVLNDSRVWCTTVLPEHSANRLSNEPPDIRWRYPYFETVTFVDTEGQQYLKLATSGNVSNLISVAEREYFRTIASGRGWKATDFCETSCALESIWSFTTGEAQAVLSKKTTLQLKPGPHQPRPAVAAISFPMRSLIGPVLPPGFAFAVIDRSGKVLFHTDRQRNGNENFFVETDNNRRLRAQVSAHSADELDINYRGAHYRAYVKPMELPGMYVVAMAQSERAWAINREWLVVALTLVAVYLVLWLAVAVVTFINGASWVWPDPRRRWRYVAVSIVCGLLLVVAIRTVVHEDPQTLVLAGLTLPLVGWLFARLLLVSSPQRRSRGGRETLVTYSVASVLVLLVTGVVPGAMLFLASYRLHAWSYIKNSQLDVAHQLADRYERLNEAYLLGGRKNPKSPAAYYTDIVSDRDIYVNFLYNTTIKRLKENTKPPHDHKDGMLLRLLEDILPYFSEASVGWRELLHDQSDDGTWESWRRRSGFGEGALRARTGKLALELTSSVPSITSVAATVKGDTRALALAQDSVTLLCMSAAGLLVLAGVVVYVFNRRVYLVGITQPLWACDSLVRNAGQNVLVLCDAESKEEQLKGFSSLDLGPIVTQQDFKRAWRMALFDVDQKSDDGSVLIADFDEGLDDVSSVDRKLLLLEELVFDPSRRVVVLSKVSLRGLTDSARHASGAGTAGADSKDSTFARWGRIMKAMVIVERRQPNEALPSRRKQRSSAVTFLLSERDSHPNVRRVCDDLLQSDAVERGRLSRAQAFDELVERTLQFYRSVWTSCSEDEKVVLGHVAKHGLANASARSVVRQLLGRGLLRADPALRPMNETFRHFILTRECAKHVEALESADGPSAWDRLRIPLGVTVVGVGLFLFATQKELYNAIFGLVTAAAASVPALIKTVGELVGRPMDGPEAKA